MGKSRGRGVCEDLAGDSVSTVVGIQTLEGIMAVEVVVEVKSSPMSNVGLRYKSVTS